jgi:hypothetical protein
MNLHSLSAKISEKQQRVTDLHDAGMSLVDVALLMQLSYSTVRYYWKRTLEIRQIEAKGGKRHPCMMCRKVELVGWGFCDKCRDTNDYRTTPVQMIGW